MYVVVVQRIIYTSPHHGRLGTLLLYISEAAMFFSINLQVPWWALKINMEKRPDIVTSVKADFTSTESQEKKKRNVHNPSIFRAAAKSSCALCQKNNLIVLSNAIVPFCYDHSMLCVSIDHCRRAHGGGTRSGFHKSGTNNKQMWSAQMDISRRLLAHDELFRLCWAKIIDVHGESELGPKEEGFFMWTLVSRLSGEKIFQFFL